MKTKEVKFRPRTEDHDLQHKMRKVVEFLEAGDKVRLVVSFRGREQAHRDIGNRLLERLIALAPDRTFVGPFRDEPRSVSVEIKFRR